MKPRAEKSKDELEHFAMPGEKPSALFTTPSFFNHSCLRTHLISLSRTSRICLANAYRAFYGDVMVVHAVDDLKKGEEVFITYVDLQLSYKERAKKTFVVRFRVSVRAVHPRPLRRALRSSREVGGTADVLETAS